MSPSFPFVTNVLHLPLKQALCHKNKSSIFDSPSDTSNMIYFSCALMYHIYRSLKNLHIYGSTPMYRIYVVKADAETPLNGWL